MIQRVLRKLKAMVLLVVLNLMTLKRSAFWRRNIPCRVCGRPLTDPKSQALGAGPTCAKRFVTAEVEAERAGQMRLMP